jgi:TRAP-type C4-dicarboxylate transport system permease large subunit
MVRPMLPFYFSMLIALLAITYIPAISLWLPERFMP